MAATVGIVIGFILRWGAIIFGLLLVIYALSLIPLEPLQFLFGGFLHFLGWIFGTAAPRLGNYILDSITHANNTTGTAPTTTVAP